MNQDVREAGKYLGRIEYDKSQDFLKKNDTDNYLKCLDNAISYGFALAEYEKGYIYYYDLYNYKDNKSNALSLFRAAADQGNADAQYYAGRMYWYGEGTWWGIDYETGLGYWKKAAEQKNPLGINGVGIAYLEGKGGVNKDYTKSEQYFKEAISLGETTYAFYNLGTVYENGDEKIPQDYKKALSWYLKANEYGNTNSYSKLGYFYENGLGTKVDYKSAFKFYLKSSETGNIESSLKTGIFYYNGWGTKKDNELSKKYLTVAYEKGNWKVENSACEYLGKIEYDTGKALADKAKTDDDWKNVFTYYSKGANYGNGDARYECGRCYEEGRGVRKDTDKALDYYLYAADYSDNAMACLNAGDIYYASNKYNSNSFAFKYWSKAEQLGVKEEAWFRLGAAYYQELGVLRDLSKAFEWIMKAAKAGHPEAQYVIAWVYHYGSWGCDVNEKEAMKWLKKSADQKFKDAVLCYKNGWEAQHWPPIKSREFESY